MVTATFRFYEELNDFLVPERRKQEFSAPCARAATVKHMIEALGVPHTEVELILVNGESVGFERQIADGDRISVYPKFEALAVAEGRIVLTRDRELLKLRDVTHGCYVHALKPSLQFKEIIGRLDLARSLRPFTLCLECNRPLRDIDKAQVIERLPPLVRERYERFTTCDVCGRIYWEGSHWQRMRELVEDAVREGY